MTELLQSLQPWHWYILAIALLVLEALAPGAVFIWMGVAAAITGVVLWAFSPPWDIQLTIFSIFSVLSIVGWRLYRQRFPAPPSPLPMLNRRMQRYVGTRLTLAEPIVNGEGQVHMKDTLWKVSGPDLPAGTQVEVVGFDGPVLKVAPTGSANP